ncbi:hypothetical protein [Teichococcus aestuarii]|uniref:hypothetical protein n=1 Tax=Teichococcus aestuarii TaxID=568898 RepID=UPI00361396C7
MPGFSTAFSRSPEAPRPVPEQPVTLREGVIATPNVSSVLAAPVRANPLGEERPGEARLLAEVMRRRRRSTGASDPWRRARRGCRPPMRWPARRSPS